MVAWQPFLHARDDILKFINERMAAATSVLLQVLYFLQEAHVQYLLRQYRDAFVDVHGANAIPRERGAPLPAPRGTRARISAGPPRTRVTWAKSPPRSRMKLKTTLT